MNLYEAIYARRSVRNYRMEPLDDTILKGIPDFLNEVEPLFPDIRIDFSGKRFHKRSHYKALLSESLIQLDIIAHSSLLVHMAKSPKIMVRNR